MGSMVGYSKAAMERAMKVQEVILRAMAKRITWWQAAGEDFSAAGSDGTGRAGAAVLSGEVLRSECAALSPETGGGARNQAELHLGQAGAAGSGTGGAGAQAGSASQAAPAPAAVGDAVAHRWQPASLVPGRALVRPAGDSRRCHQRDLLRAAGGRRIHADGDRGADAVQAFQRMLEVKGYAGIDPLMPLANLGLARAYALAGDKARSRVAYQDFLGLWKDADSDLPLLREAKVEYAKVQ